MKTLLLICSLAILQFQSGAQTIDSLDRVLSIQYAFPMEPECKKPEVGAFFKAVREVRNDWLGQQRIEGKASFATNGDFQPRNDLFKMNGNFSFSRGKFPSELEVKAGVGVTLQNGTLQENISDLSISYDYHPRAFREPGKELCTKDGELLEPYLKNENYAYISRFTDNFMRIDQRYEIGIGTVFAYWSKKMTEDGAKRERAYTAIRNCDCNVGGPIDSCLRSVARLTGNAPVDGAMSEVRKANTRAMVTARKRHATMRCGILLGIMGEMEKTATFSDSLWADSALVAFAAPGVSAMHLRYVVRPFIDLQPTRRTTFSLRPYFVLPAPWEWLSSTRIMDRSGNEYLEERVDWRLYSELKANVKLTNLDDQSNGEVSVGISYRMWYDGSPNRKASNAFDARGFQQLVVSPEIHNQFLFDVSIKL